MLSERYKHTLIIISVTAIVAITSLLFTGSLSTKSKTRTIVNLMYTFNSYEELSHENMPKLESYCTKEMVSKLTIKNKDLLETMYYKFRGFKTEAIIKEIKSTNNSSITLFSLNNEMIDEERLFSLELKFNFFGKVTDAKLYEVVKQYI